MHQITVPTSVPMPAVRAIANAPQNVTRVVALTRLRHRLLRRDTGSLHNAATLQLRTINGNIQRRCPNGINRHSGDGASLFWKSLLHVLQCIENRALASSQRPVRALGHRRPRFPSRRARRAIVLIDFGERSRFNTNVRFLSFDGRPRRSHLYVICCGA